MKIRKQMFGAMALIMAIFIATIVLMSTNATELKYFTTLSQNSYGMDSAFSNLEASIMRFRSEQHTLANNIDRFKTARDGFRSLLDEVNSGLDDSLIDTELQERIKKINSLWDNLEKKLNTVITSLEAMEKKPIKNLFNNYPFGNIMSDTQLILQNTSYKQEFNTINNINRDLIHIGSSSGVLKTAITEMRDNLSQKVSDKSATNQYISVVALIIAVIVAGIIALIFSSSMSKKINQIKDILHNISKKDLTVSSEIKSKDEFQELGEYLTELITVLQGFMESAADSAHKVTETNSVLTRETHESEESLNKIHDRVNDVRDQFSKLDNNIDESSKDITYMDEEIVKIVDHINNQSQAVTTSSSSIEQMTASVSQIANLTARKQQSTRDLLTIVAQGGESVENTFDNIQQVNSELIQIKELVEVIKNVADQTNILSMNAAIESAHAGEAGKGFSVVADEIRSLAEYTSNNVSAINKAIKSISVRIESSLQASEESSSVFEKINRDVNEFSDAMIEISSSIDELAAGGEEVLRSTAQVSELNSRVRDGAGRIKEQSAIIEDAMLSVKSVSSDVNSHIIRIAKRTNDILKSFKGINDVSVQSGDRISDLTKRMEEFKLS